ncbi:M24 family metallopeptidase [Peribacillus sp. SCS-37]|uniref:M24 family metallopeptidase n=1 Tax=Paraperibacillus esterisolvens TaxID=3115296 RepID=UPI003905DF05
MSKRIEKFQDWLTENEITFGFITSPESVFYLSGFRSNPHERLLALGLFPDSEPFLVCPKMETEDAMHSGWSHQIIGYTDIEDSWAMIMEAVKDRNITLGSAAIEKEHMNVERFEKIQSLMPGAAFFPAGEILRELRMIKDEKELTLIREAARLADCAIETGVREIAEGKTEMEVLAAIEFEMKKAGINEMSFSTMVLTGANGASPHGTPGQTKIKQGDLVLFDLGVVYEGYCSDITRTVAFGEITEKQRDIYETVLKAEEAAIKACRPGATCAELDLIARNIISDAGYGEYFPHRLGHGLGISVHEYPSLTETNELVLKPGMVFTIEPGIYVPGIAGVRIEDDILITEYGCEVLTRYPKAL